MKFDDDIVTVQPIITGTDIKFFVAYDATEEDLKEMVPAITVSNKATVNPASGSKVDFSGDPVKFTVTAEDGVTKTVYTVTCEKGASPEAEIISVTFSAPVVVEQPTIDGTNIHFFVAANATDEDLKKLTPVIEISAGATIDPASGSPVDFSNGAVEFTVTSQDKANTTVYTVSYQRIGKYDFEEWIIENPTALENRHFYAPIGGWSSSNKGADLLITFNSADRVCVTKTTDSHGGTTAAKIETLDTKGKAATFFTPNIPKVTTGSLFIGEFDILSAMKNTLTATKFGIPYSKKPLEIRGYYKYAPGNEFYRATGQDDCHLAKIELGTTDQCAINAILYEIDDDNSPYITGVDTYNFVKNERLVAIAELADGTAKSSYTAFSIKMDYKKPYDSTKKYRFAIICSSSAEGQAFSGAPGSVLYVDDIEVISE